MLSAEINALLCFKSAQATIHNASKGMFLTCNSGAGLAPLLLCQQIMCLIFVCFGQSRKHNVHSINTVNTPI